MELALPERFDTRQALRYLGISTEEPDSATRALLRRAERTLRAAAGPRAVAVRAARDDISPYLQGNDILRHLEGCVRCSKVLVLVVMIFISPRPFTRTGFSKAL